MHKFTPQQKEFIAKNVYGRGNVELTKLFNAHFGLDLSVTQIKSFKKNNKLSSGLNGRFSKGHIPANKGKKGVGGWEPTQFKKGHMPHNYKPVGSERIDVDGYTWIKVKDPKTWRMKHVLIWEKENGSIPRGHVIIFGDGNRQNFNPENLLLVSQKQLVRMNQKKLIQNSAELTKAGIIVADIYNKIGELKRSNKKKRIL